jgi:mannose-6-phosphate isomerase-like protein (cupin superfamily)
MNHMERMSVKKALELVAASGNERYGVLLEHGTLEIGFYAPSGTDPQRPHDQDEVYVVHAGTGTFVNGDDEQPFGPGDVLFVAAGATHRFRDFSDDFGAWVVFYGPSGGEREA